MSLNTVILTTRPSFLVLTPVCVLLGLSLAIAAGSPINYLMLALTLLGAISAHISVNTLNEYSDFSSGLDLRTEKTPFSGGSGALPDNPHMANAVLMTGLIALLGTIAIGIYLLFETGLQLLPVGIVGVALVASYTGWINRSPFLCLIAPGLGFGLLMVVGTYIVLTGEQKSLVWLVSLVPFCLINNLLLLNQYPDMGADATVGRRTFPIVFGLNQCNVIYAIFTVVAYSLIVLLVVKGLLPTMSMIALVPMMLSLVALIGAIKYSANIGHFPAYMASNVAAAILTPLLLAISIFYG